MDRQDMDDSMFAIPDTRRYPIHNKAAAKLALQRVALYGNDAEKLQVNEAVKTKFPKLDTQGNITANFQHVTFNMAPKVSYQSMEGRDYMVVPVVMLTEGVHAGSNGPLYYPANELSKTPAVWNHKPIVVYHPTAAGEAISACQPAVISSRKVGLIMNAKYHPAKKGLPGKLNAEAWLETNRLKLVDERILSAIEQGEMVEVSTGLFTDNEQTEGQWRKEAYTAIARNYRPDHLAILPDEVGACSIKDGAGLLRNSGTMSHGEIRDKLQDAIKKSKTLPFTAKGTDVSSPWVRDVYDTFCVYAHNGKMYQHKYAVDEDNGVALSGSPVEVVASQKYMTTDGKVINTGAPMTKATIVNALIENAASPFDEDDRDTLESFSTNKLSDLLANFKKEANGQDVVAGDGGDGNDGENTTAKGAKEDIQPKKATSTKGKTNNKGAKCDEDEDDTMGGKKKPTDNQRQPVTMEDYINNAPEGIRDVLVNGVAAHTQQKTKLIASITANKKNTFTKEFLATKGLQELHAIAALAAPQAAPVANGANGHMNRFTTNNFGGLGEVSPGTNVTDNSETFEEEALEVPVMNFSKVKAEEE